MKSSKPLTTGWQVWSIYLFIYFVLGIINNSPPPPSAPLTSFYHLGIDKSEFNRRENITVWRQWKLTWKTLKSASLFSLEMALNIVEKGFTMSNIISHRKKWKLWSILLFSKLWIWHQIWIAGVRHGNSLVVRRVSHGRIIVLLFERNYAVPRQIRPGILKGERPKQLYHCLCFC